MDKASGFDIMVYMCSYTDIKHIGPPTLPTSTIGTIKIPQTVLRWSIG